MNDATEYRCPGPGGQDGRRCNGLLGRGRVDWYETKCLRGHLVRIEGDRVTVVESSRAPEMAGASR